MYSIEVRQPCTSHSAPADVSGTYLAPSSLLLFIGCLPYVLLCIAMTVLWLPLCTSAFRHLFLPAPPCTCALSTISPFSWSVSLCCFSVFCRSCIEVNLYGICLSLTDLFHSAQYCVPCLMAQHSRAKVQKKKSSASRIQEPGKIYSSKKQWEQWWKPSSLPFKTGAFNNQDCFFQKNGWT